MQIGKPSLRLNAKKLRDGIIAPNAAQDIITHFPDHLTQTTIAGFAPTQSEINIWPLLHHLHAAGRSMALPVVTAPDGPLTFRHWTPETEMATDHYGIAYPCEGEAVTPDFILVPLLAFTAQGERLGYGGGYYDRTLEKIRAELRPASDVFACGVAYAAQEVASLPTDAHDARLDGILTEHYFKAFT